MAKTSRRKFLYGTLGGLGLGVLGTWIFRRPILKKLFMTGKFDASLLEAAPADPESICVLTSRQVEGPFFFPSPERRDIREDRQGLDMNLRFQVLRHPDCSPIAGAVVELWHCDAEGTYSGYPEEITHDVWKEAMFFKEHGVQKDGELHVDPLNDKRFLRGRQRTDEEGWVAFDTIFPGWYEGRVPHLHAMIQVGETEQLLTQFYFETELCNQIYTTMAPYDQYGECPMDHSQDTVLAGGTSAKGLLLKMNPPQGNQPVQAMAKIGIAMA